MVRYLLFTTRGIRYKYLLYTVMTVKSVNRLTTHENSAASWFYISLYRYTDDPDESTLRGPGQQKLCDTNIYMYIYIYLQKDITDRGLL